RQRVERAIAPVARLDAEEALGLAARLEVRVAPGEELRILEARQVVIGCHLEHTLEQLLGIIERLPLEADAGEQPHGLDVISLRAKIRPDEGFGGRDLPIAEERG